MMMSKLCHLGFILGLMTASSCKRSSETPPTPVQPDVVLITLDTTRADHLGCYGYPKNITPHLDGLASRGVRFTRAIAQASVTPVSHASILTGRNPYSHGLRVMHGRTHNRLTDEQTTLAEVLQRNGYRTAAFVSAFPVTKRFGLHQGFDRFDADFLVDKPESLVSKEGVVNTGKNQRRADVTTDHALKWMATTSSPFFLWLHYFDPHDPQVLPPPEVLARLGAPPGNAPERTILRALYDIEIAYMDEQIGRVLDDLAKRSADHGTIIVVVADHGEGLGDHDWWTHGILYQEQLRVPLIIQAPTVAAGKRIDVVVRTIDIMPTVLSLARIAPDTQPEMDGASLVPLLADGAADPGYAAYSDSLSMITYGFTQHIRDVKQDRLLSLLSGPWKYIHHIQRPAESELYNLADDPHELNNVIRDHRVQADKMRSDLISRKCIPGQSFRKNQVMSPEDLERLRTLGYIDDR